MYIRITSYFPIANGTIERDDLPNPTTEHNSLKLQFLFT